MNFKYLSQKIASKLLEIPFKWNSRLAVLELSKDCYAGWEQSEWLDFYFRYLCEKYLPDYIPMHDKVCGTTFFDGIHDLSPDFGEKIFPPNPGQDLKDKSSDFNREFTLAYSNYQHWRQMEWIESYFSYLCVKHLSGFLKIPGPRYKKRSFDGFLEIPWLFKVFIENTGNKNIILADADLMVKGISKYEKIGIVVAEGRAEYYKEKADKNMRQNSMFILKNIFILPFTADVMQKCKTFQLAGIKTGNGLPEKILLDIAIIRERTVSLQKYS
ncbi:MAG: hypothetical protein PHD33_01210 [Atribacterota bacterium]|nr:hypothetical protein [Atribacterota bacterium]